MSEEKTEEKNKSNITKSSAISGSTLAIALLLLAVTATASYYVGKNSSELDDIDENPQKIIQEQVTQNQNEKEINPPPVNTEKDPDIEPKIIPGTLSVSSLMNNLSVYANSQLDVRGRMVAVTLDSAIPCQDEGPCTTLLGVLIWLYDENDESIFVKLGKSLGDGQFEELECEVLPGNDYDCGSYPIDQVVTLDGTFIDYQNPTASIGSSTGPPTPIEFETAYIFLIE